MDFAKSVGWLKDKKQINAIRNAYQSAENIVSGDENHSSEGVKKEEGKSSHPSGKTTPKISTKKKAATQSQQKSHIQPASTIKV